MERGKGGRERPKGRASGRARAKGSAKGHAGGAAGDPPSGSQGGVSAAYLLLALGLLVFVVSMPRFRAHVVEENTADAGTSLLLVGEVAFERGEGDLIALLREEASLRHRMRDARPALVSGRLTHHGYFLDDALLVDGTRAFGAWPIDYGRSGRDAWLVTPSGELWRHPNGGRWTGEARPLALVDPSREWRRVPMTATR